MRRDRRSRPAAPHFRQTLQCTPRGAHIGSNEAPWGLLVATPESGPAISRCVAYGVALPKRRGLCDRRSGVGGRSWVGVRAAWGVGWGWWVGGRGSGRRWGVPPATRALWRSRVVEAERPVVCSCHGFMFCELVTPFRNSLQSEERRRGGLGEVGGWVDGGPDAGGGESRRRRGRVAFSRGTYMWPSDVCCSELTFRRDHGLRCSHSAHSLRAPSRARLCQRTHATRNGRATRRRRNRRKR